MSAQTPLPKDDPLIVAWEAHKATEEHANDVRWAKVEAHTVGSLWSAFEAGWRAREATLSAAGLVVVPREPTREMCIAGDAWLVTEDVYRAMIAAALPAAPQEDRDDGR